jgi:hypothetical protein
MTGCRTSQSSFQFALSQSGPWNRRSIGTSTSCHHSGTEALLCSYERHAEHHTQNPPLGSGASCQWKSSAHSGPRSSGSGSCRRRRRFVGSHYATPREHHRPGRAIPRSDLSSGDIPEHWRRRGFSLQLQSCLYPRLPLRARARSPKASATRLAASGPRGRPLRRCSRPGQ